MVKHSWGGHSELDTGNLDSSHSISGTLHPLKGPRGGRGLGTRAKRILIIAQSLM